MAGNDVPIGRRAERALKESEASWHPAGPFRLGTAVPRVKIGAKGVAPAQDAIFQMAEVAVPRRLFAAILERMRRLRLPKTVPG